MQAWKIITHSVRQVFGNFGPAIRLSAVLYVVQWGIVLGLNAVFGAKLAVAGTGDAAELTAMKALFGPALLSFAVLLLADIWIAVAWHRYVLKGEQSRSLVPVFAGRRMLAYLGAMVLLFLVFGMLAAGTVLLASLAARLFGAGVLLNLVPVVFLILGGGLMLRLSTVLAGFALEPGHRLTEGWQATRGHSLDFFLLALIVGVTINIVQNVTAALLSGVPLVLLVVSFLLQWVITMVGVSILTTLYGHYIEKRALV
jgi:hypothetical protein